MKSPAPQFVTHLSCTVCGTQYPHGNLFTCSRCGAQGILDVIYDYRRVGACLTSASLHTRPHSIWRYAELLPVGPQDPPAVPQIGWTPVYDAGRLAKAIGISRLYLKDDGRNPTNSFKDRAGAIGVMKAREFGFDTIACASTGNAASSLAGLSAAAGLRCFIFVPERAPEPKITQLLIFGATVLKIRGTYEQAFDLCTSACGKFVWYNRNSGMNPYLVEGKKTAGLELAEQFGKELPDWVAVSVGDGCTIGGIGKGLREMKMLGFIDRMPRLLGVQAEGASPVFQAFHSGKDLVPSGASTLADSIAVGTPRNWRRAVNEIRTSKGGMVTVSDQEILRAMELVAKLGGVFGEPAGVACVAGLQKAVASGLIKPGETAAAVITGNGLKDIRSAQRAAGKPLDVEPHMAALERALKLPV